MNNPTLRLIADSFRRAVEYIGGDWPPSLTGRVRTAFEIYLQMVSPEQLPESLRQLYEEDWERMHNEEPLTDEEVRGMKERLTQIDEALSREVPMGSESPR